MAGHSARCGHCEAPLTVVIEVDATELNQRLASIEGGIRKIMRALNLDPHDSEEHPHD